MPETECGAEYEREGGRQRGDRIVRCGLPADHDSRRHMELDTGVTWSAGGRASMYDERLLDQRAAREEIQARIQKGLDLLARADGHIGRIETRTRADRDVLVFVQDQIHAAMVTLNPKLGEVPAEGAGRG